MDFAQRDQQSKSINQASSSSSGSSKKKGKVTKWFGASFVLMLFSGTILAVALIAYLFVGGPKSESKFVKSDNYQAVFLNNGQVYFGRIKDINNKYALIQSIFYLRQTQSPQPDQGNSSGTSNFSLVKLGCEIHGPADEMVINRDQITFWENLKTDGQVAKAVADFIKQNPNGQKCSETSTNKQ
jgi:hypothetical protein